MEWKDTYSLGVPEIDAQHKELFKLLSMLQIAIRERNCDEAYANTLRALVSYTHSHFIDEEKYMLSIHYPKYPEQKNMHDNLIKKTRDILIRLKKGQAIQPISLMRFLNDWITRHILHADMQIGEFVRNNRTHSLSGQSSTNPLKNRGIELIAIFQSLETQWTEHVISEETYTEQGKNILKGNFGNINLKDPGEFKKVISFFEYMQEHAVLSADHAHLFKQQIAHQALASDILATFSETEEKDYFIKNLLKQKLVDEEDFKKCIATLQAT